MHLAYRSLVCTQPALLIGGGGRIHRSTTILARRGPAMSQERHWNNTDAIRCSLKERKNTCLADLALLLNVKWCWSHVPILRSFSFPRADEARACVTTAVSRCGHSRPRRISCCNHHWSKNLFIYSWNPDGYACSLTNFSVQLQIAHVFLFFFIWHTYLS